MDNCNKTCKHCLGSGFIKNIQRTKEIFIKVYDNKFLLEEVSPYKTCDSCYGTGSENYIKFISQSCCLNLQV